MLTRTLGLGLLAASLASASPELVRRQDDGSGPQIYLNSESDFCLFLPPQPGLEVATHEDDGIPFCTTAGAVPNAQAFPQGFLTTAHYQQTDSYQQITGFFNRDAYQLQAGDGGGQYDNHGAGKPINAACRNYEYFLSIIEPSDNRFCIRCCHNKDDCPTGRSEYGCQRNIPGDYTMSAQANDGSQASGAPAEPSAPAESSPAAPADPAQASDASGQQAPQQQVAASTKHNNAAFDSVLYDMDTLQNQASGAMQQVENKADSAGDALSNEASKLADQLQNNHADAATEEEASSNDQQLQGQWSDFLQSLSTQFPDKEQDIEKLKQMTSDFSTEEDWQRLISTLSSSADSSDSSSGSSASADETQHEDQAVW
ncbi:hypothetical protein BCR43DRAFT_489809 [Syncephalastrum racemosum]|uniref:Uncharacterized protein n=1 Tax=Syncephalastrum racemosum TaxID=13706 RepID=A0A1X2HEY6_SYNRA|nr:hypothetical protein BCR43DRAFT_489809 [Syncephalastrum racemosum]